MKELKLLQLIPSLKSGGVEQGTIDVANYIGSKGHKSLIVSNGGKMETLINRKNVKHIYLPVHTKNIIKIIQNSFKLKKIINDHQINIVHVRSRAPAWSLNFIRKKNFITVSTFHNIYGHNNFLKKFYNKGLSKADKIIAISNYVKQSIIDIYNIKSSKITVINRGVDTDFFKPTIENKDNYINFLSRFNITSEKKIILFPGRLTSWKGQIKFLDVIDKLKEKNFVCYFVGDDKNKSYSKKLIIEIKKKKLDSTCRILGNLTRDELKLMYHTSDLIISAPNKPEGFGRTIAESLSMKKIVLGFSFGGVKDQFEKLDEFFSVTPLNYKEMEQKIAESLNFSQNKINKIVVNSRNHVINNYSKSLMLQKYYKFYNQVLK